MSKKNLTWGPNTSSYSSGINHGYEDSTQGKKAQQLENSAQAMFGKTGDERFLRHIGDAPSGSDSWNTMENDPKKRWGGSKKTKSKSKTHKKTKRAHKKKIHRKH
jgi:hypothetical protein